MRAYVEDVPGAAPGTLARVVVESPRLPDGYAPLAAVLHELCRTTDEDVVALTTLVPADPPNALFRRRGLHGNLEHSGRGAAYDPGTSGWFDALGPYGGWAGLTRVRPEATAGVLHGVAHGAREALFAGDVAYVSDEALLASFVTAWVAAPRDAVTLARVAADAGWTVVEPFGGFDDRDLFLQLYAQPDSASALRDVIAPIVAAR